MSNFKPKSPESKPISKSPEQKEVLSLVLGAMKGLVIDENSPRDSSSLMRKLNEAIKSASLNPDQKKALSHFFASRRFRPGFKPEQLGEVEAINEMTTLINGLEGMTSTAANILALGFRRTISHNLREAEKRPLSSVELRKKLKAYVVDSDLDPELKRITTALLYIIKPEKYLEQWPTADEVLERSRGSQKHQAKAQPASQSKVVKPGTVATETPQKKASAVSDWINQGRHNLLLKRYKEAIRAFKTALQEDSESSMAADALEEAYLQLAEREEGLAILVAETANDPRDAVANMYVGMASLHRNDFRIAKIYYLKALGLNQVLESKISAALRKRQHLEKSKGMKGIESDLAEINKLIEKIFPAKPVPDARFQPQGISEVPESWKTPAQKVALAAMPPVEQLLDEAEAKGFDWENHDPEPVSYTEKEMAEMLKEIGWEVKPADTARLEEADDELSDLPPNDEPLDFELDIEPALGVDNWGDAVELPEEGDPAEHIVKGYISQGEIHMEKGEWEGAEEAFGWALKRASGLTSSATVIGYIQQKLGEVQMKQAGGKNEISDEPPGDQFDKIYAVISDMAADEKELRQAIIDYHHLREENRNFPFDHLEVAIHLREHMIACNNTMVTPEIIIMAHESDILTRNRLGVPVEQLYRSHAECGLTFEKLGDREGRQKNWPLAFDYLKKAQAQYQHAHRLMQQSSDPDHTYAWVRERAGTIGRKVKFMKQQSE